MKYLILLIFPISILLNKFLKKNKILLNYSGEQHQIFSSNKNIPLIGGFFLVLLILFLHIDVHLKIMSLFIFFLGLFSDLKIIKSPNQRFLLQIFLILLFVIYQDLRLENLRINILEDFLKNKYFNYFFVTFCIITLINGTNFIDGVNGNVLIYYFSIYLIIYLLDSNFFQIISFNQLEIILILIFFLIILNLKNILFLGDSGSYLISFFSAIFLIKFYLNNQFISPFFIALLIWYPIFENLFSIIRKFKLNKSPMSPDTFHLHHKILKFLIKKKIKFSNNLTGILINTYNLIIIYVGFLNISNTQVNILLIILNILVYCFLYGRLKSK